MRKSPKNRLGRSPLGTPLWYQAGTASSLYFGPSPLLWLLPLPPHQAPWAAGPMARWFPPPGLLWKSGVPAAGGQAPDSWEQRLTRVRPWQSKRVLSEESTRTVEQQATYVTPPRTRAETRRTQVHPVPRGGFHKAGEGPAFGGSLVTFCPVRKLPCGAHLAVKPVFGKIEERATSVPRLR